MILKRVVGSAELVVMGGLTPLVDRALEFAPAAFHEPSSVGLALFRAGGEQGPDPI